MSGPSIPVLEMAAELCERYQIADLRYFLESCRAFARAGTLNIAIFGRFKAGKSSFLNHLLGAPILPVGVIPVTSVITEIEFGPQERAEVRFLDGHAAAIRPHRSRTTSRRRPIRPM
jgi:predicted GTPase